MIKNLILYKNKQTIVPYILGDTFLQNFLFNSYLPVQTHKGGPGMTEGQTLDGGTMWSGVPDHLRQLPSRLCRWDRESISQVAEGAPAPWFPSTCKWPPSRTQPQLHKGGCSGETPREGYWSPQGVVESIHIAEERPSLMIEVITPTPWSTDSCCHHVTLVTHMITGSPWWWCGTSVFWRRPVELGWKLNFARCSLVSTWVSIYVFHSFLVYFLFFLSTSAQLAQSCLFSRSKICKIGTNTTWSWWYENVLYQQHNRL